MSKIIKKAKLLFKGNRHLGDILLIQLHDGKHSLKLSFKNKVGPFKVWGKHMGPVTSVDFSKPVSVKDFKDGESFDISYNFENRKLEVKQEGAGPAGSIERRFYDVPHPIDRHLFTLYLNDRTPLNEVTPEEGDLILDNQHVGEKAAVSFSFTEEHGNAFMDPELNFAQMGRSISLPLEGVEHNELKIAVLTNDRLPSVPEHFLITVPYGQTKRT